jgi:hypothetical protein
MRLVIEAYWSVVRARETLEDSANPSNWRVVRSRRTTPA